MTISPEIILTVLSALLTGGFLILAIEIFHLSASVSDRYYSVMKPFYHKLTNYVGFMSFMQLHFSFQKTDNEYALSLKRIINDIAALSEKIVLGINIPTTALSPKELDDICEYSIGNVWYYLSEKWNYIKDVVIFDDRYIDDIAKECLGEISDKYKESEINLELIANVSDDFDRNIYQPIQEVPFQFEKWVKIEKEFRSLSSSSVFFILFSILIIALLGQSISYILLSAILITNVLIFVFVFSVYIDMDKKSKIIIRI